MRIIYRYIPKCECCGVRNYGIAKSERWEAILMGGYNARTTMTARTRRGARKKLLRAYIKDAQ